MIDLNEKMNRLWIIDMMFVLMVQKLYNIYNRLFLSFN